MKRKRRKLHALKQRERGWGGYGRLSAMSGVSRALWPVELRQSAAVGRNAQRRRMMRSLWWSVRLHLSQVRLLYIWVAVALLVGGCFLVLLVLRQRHAFIIVTMLAIVTVLHVLVSHLWRFVRPRLVRLPHALSEHFVRWWNRRIELSSKPETPKVQSMSIMRTPRLSMSLRAPETPMPEAPLIRVLETIDLSTCDVEHFLDTSVNLRSLPALDEDECFTDEYMMI